MRRMTPGSSITAIRRIGPLQPRALQRTSFIDLADEPRPGGFYPRGELVQRFDQYPGGVARGCWPVGAVGRSPRKRFEYRPT
jgi:hypothetical protein